MLVALFTVFIILQKSHLAFSSDIQIVLQSKLTPDQNCTESLELMYKGPADVMYTASMGYTDVLLIPEPEPEPRIMLTLGDKIMICGINMRKTNLQNVFYVSNDNETNLNLELIINNFEKREAGDEIEGRISFESIDGNQTIYSGVTNLIQLLYKFAIISAIFALCSIFFLCKYLCQSNISVKGVSDSSQLIEV